MSSRFGLRTSVALVTLAGVLVLAGTVIGATLQKNGKTVTAVRTETSDEGVSTSLYEWSDMPNMSVTVSVPSGEKALFLITFSAAVRCTSDDADDGECMVRVLVDGNTAPPGEVMFASGRDNEWGPPYGTQAHSMQFVSSPNAGGSHIVKVQWKRLSDPIFIVTQRTLTVLRSKL